MKKSLFIALFCSLVAVGASAQNSSASDSRSTIEISSQVDSLVEPNLITLNIKLTSSEGAARRGMEQAQTKLSQTLKGLGINADEDLYVKSIGSSYDEKGRHTDISQVYSLLLTESLLAQQVIAECQRQNIAVSVEKLDISNRKAVELELCRKALLEAKAEAQYLAAALNQEVGKACSISKHTYVNYHTNLMSMRADAEYAPANRCSELAVVQKVKISASVNVYFQLL